MLAKRTLTTPFVLFISPLVAILVSQHPTNSNSTLILLTFCMHADSCVATLPEGCVLDWILRAQKLDSLDTALAVRIYDRLCDRYRDLKRSHTTTLGSSTMVESFSNEAYCALIEKFIDHNLDDLEKVQFTQVWLNKSND